MTIDIMRSSRLIVKNLPNSVTQEKLKDHFSAKGIVTDVKLKNTPDGKFRHFAFVGFKTEEEAEEAQQYFDKTFVGASRITVELCHNLGEKPKSQSKKVRDRQKAESLRQKAKEKAEAPPPEKRTTKEDEILEKYGEDPAFMEFLQAHKKSTTTWGNDTLVDELRKLQDNKKKKKRKHDEDEEEDEDECEVEAGEEDKAPTKKKSKKAAVEGTTKETKKPAVEFFTLKLRDVPKKARKKDVKGFFAPLKLKSIRFPQGVRGIVYVGFATEADRIKGLQRNKSFLLGNQIRLNIYSAKDGDGDTTPKGKWQSLTEDLEKNAEPVGESGRIFLRNLPYTTNEDEVTKLFEEFGPVTEVHLPIDKISRKLKGIGFVSFMLPEHAGKAFGALDGTVFQGRMLHLLPAKSKEELTGDETSAGSSFKTEKEHKQKKSAGSSHNWNALFLGPSAVAKVISEKYGISREEMLLDKNDDEDGKLASVGVRMALAETEIVVDTKKFLEQNGVCLEAFDSTDKKLERSKTVMLVKNLPAGTTSDDIKNVFVKHGVLNRIILPSSGITAIVEFAEPAEARAAFKKLAYSKFYNLPLYLEWAPQGVFVRPADAKDIMKREPELAKATTAEESTQPQASKASQILQSVQFEPVDENAVPELDTTLFVKNLNFRTVEEPLKKHFLQCGPVFAVTVARKKNPSNPEVLLSMGYGFVQFYRTKDADTALTTLNGTMLENHILELKRSTRTLAKTSTETTKKKGNGTKLLVRNVPFQATQEEITDLFTTFGKIKAVRLPRKLTGNGEHRGFGFIEYYSDSDALKAYDTLCKSTHLYGRRLVLEWASQDESIEDLRAKTARLARAATDGEDQGSLGSTKKNFQRYFKSQTATSATKDDEEENDE